MHFKHLFILSIFFLFLLSCTEDKLSAEIAQQSTQTTAQASEKPSRAEAVIEQAIAKATSITRKKQTVDQVIEKYGEKTKQKLTPLFEKANVTYPPKKLVLIAFKDTDILQIWASNQDAPYQLITSYPIQASSGVLGPKLREGDKQVPEGIYKITAFNPNSSYHLSMKINYPNAFDLKHAKAEGRTEPGTNIFIHGRALSVGCLAMGDSAIEQLFSLVHAVGRSNTQVLISPTDPSKNKLEVPQNAPSWIADLYQKIEKQYQQIVGGSKSIDVPKVSKGDHKQ